MECIGYKSSDPFNPRPVFRAVGMDCKPIQPPPPGLLSHPAFQAIEMAYEIEKLIHSVK
jgi:hypothetical protein